MSASISYVSITTFGAVADGTTDNHAAIQNALNNATINHVGVYIPAGVFAYSGQLEDNGVAITGTGTTSVLKALDPTDEDIHITGSGASVSYISIQGNGTTRLSTPWSEPIWADHATNYTVNNVTIDRGPAGSIISTFSSNGLIENNTITNSLADSITAIQGSNNITIKGNLIKNSGDDGISVVSYTSDPIVHDITIQGNTVLGNYWGRGITDVGGNSVQIIGNHVEGGTADVAGIYVAAENGWGTQGVNGCTVSGNTIIDGGGYPNDTGMGAITLCNSQGSAYSLTNITVTGNQIVNPRSNGIQYVGNGVIQATATNNIDYSLNAFSSSGDPSALISSSGNTVKAPSTTITSLVPAGSGAASAPPASSGGSASPVTLGSGSDTLVLNVSEDAWQGDAQFTVSVDSTQIGGIFSTTASHAAGASQAITFKGDFGTGNHTVTLNFLNDAWGGTAATDRNLYVKDVKYDGIDTGQSAALMSSGPRGFSVTDNTAVPRAAIGSGSDSLVVTVSEDAYQGNAQFTVGVDGKQLGSTLTATTLHSSGSAQSFTFKGDFGAGSHIVAVKFLNDAYGGSPSTDRNLYVNDVIYNGADTGQSAAEYSVGSAGFSVTGGTVPSISETGDHGSLQKNLSQTGTYHVGSDTFLLNSGDLASVTLGTGTAQLKFLGAQSVTLTSGSGQAVVTADMGSNKFTAGAGSLDVVGGPGKSAYVFHANSGALTIEDFSVAMGDTITLDKSLQGSMHQTTDGVGGVMLTFGTTSQYVDVHGLASVPNSSTLWS